MVVFVLLTSMLGAPIGDVATGVEDSTITARIETLYLLDQHLNPLNINTTTRNGNVVITGTVNDEVQKELAEDLALGVTGVAFVDNQLAVINTVVGEKEKRSWRQRLEDRSVSAAVKARMLYNGEFKGLKIGVTTINNIVSLYGVVPSEEHREAIAAIASETKGVRDVVNDLLVRPKDSPDPLRSVGRKVSDEWLESRVRTAFFLNRHLSTREFDVDVIGGICILTGSVNSVEKQRVAGDIAMSIQGIREVRNHITVREGSEVVDPVPEPDESVPDEGVKDEPVKDDGSSAPLVLEGSEPNEGAGGDTPRHSPAIEETSLDAP